MKLSVRPWRALRGTLATVQSGRGSWIACLLSSFLLATPAAATRIVAVGDVHGALDGLVEILQTAGLIDEQQHWIGGDATFVQTGDLTDRGPEVRGVMDLMMALEGQAAAAGGRVVALLGNHEVNNLVGYYSPDSNSPEAFAKIVGAFADDRSKSSSRKAYSAWRSWRRRYPQCGPDHTRQSWLAERPLGFTEYVEALGPQGVYGRWLRARQIVTRIDDTIFLHGGLAPDPPVGFPTDSLEAVNGQVALELERFDADRAWLEAQDMVLPVSNLFEIFCAVRAELALLGTSETAEATARRTELQELHDRLPLPATWLAFHTDGPLWFRGYANWTDDEGAAKVEALTRAWGVRRFVVGHTPRTGSIQARFQDRLFLIDTGMVFGAAAGGRPSALEILDGQTRALYPGDERPTAAGRPAEPASSQSARAAQGSVWMGPDDQPLPFSSPQEVLDFLSSATVESAEEIEVGVTKPRRLMMSRGTVRSKAVFRHVDITGQRKRLSSGKMDLHFRDSYKNEVAAYELSRMLAMRNVPPAVLREIDGQSGSVQMWVENAMMETHRREKKIEPPDRLRFNRQFHDMRVFDNLINNTDRNSGNILLDADWNLWLIDHTRSFSRAKELPAPEDVVACSRPLFTAIKALAEDQVAERLSPYLAAAEIQALHERRRRLVAILEQLIAKRGEDRVLFEYGTPDSSVQIVYEPSA